jgi:hypothetical protein
MKQILFFTGLVLLAQQAYSRPENAAGNQPPVAIPAAGQAGSFSGKVTETMNAASYTYIQVDTGTKKVWAAAPEFKVKVGDTVAVAGGMPMQQYHSKTLNRDFDLVYFTGDVTVNGARPNASDSTANLPPNHPPLPGAATAAAPMDFSGIKKAPGGKSVQEIITDKAKLNGKEVKLRGKVVKYNPNILGKNWLHVRDGTGSAGSNDLLVTTTTSTKVGDTVLVTGKVATDKDFGANYKYAVMVEDAKVVVE